MSKMSSSSSSSSKMARRPKGKKAKGTAFPPQIFSSNILISHKFRFMSTGAFNGQILDTFLFGVVGSVAATNLLAYSLAQTIKLKSVEVWAPVSAQGALATVSLTWPSTGQNMAKEATDTTGSVSRMAHIYSRPPKQSLSGFANAGVGNAIFSLNIPTASIIDVSMQWVQYDSLNANGVGQVITVGANVGSLTYGYLDSLTVAGALLKPVGLVPAP